MDLLELRGKRGVKGMVSSWPFEFWSGYMRFLGCLCELLDGWRRSEDALSLRRTSTTYRCTNPSSLCSGTSTSSQRRLLILPIPKSSVLFKWKNTRLCWRPQRLWSTGHWRCSWPGDWALWPVCYMFHVVDVWRIRFLCGMGSTWSYDVDLHQQRLIG